MRTSSQRTKSLTITEAAALSLLAIEGESSGYDLLRQARKSVANIWAPAKTQLYAVLPRLVAAGLATQRAVVQERRPDKQLYRITPAGRAELQRWLDDPGDTDRSAFFLRLFVGGLADQDSLVGHVERFRERDAAELERLRAIVPTNTRTGHDAYHWFLLELGIEEYEQRIRGPTACSSRSERPRREARSRGRRRRRRPHPRRMRVGGAAPGGLRQLARDVRAPEARVRLRAVLRRPGDGDAAGRASGADPCRGHARPGRLRCGSRCRAGPPRSSSAAASGGRAIRGTVTQAGLRGTFVLRRGKPLASGGLGVYRLDSGAPALRHAAGRPAAPRRLRRLADPRALRRGRVALGRRLRPRDPQTR